MMKVCEVRGCQTTANGGGRFCDMHSSCPLVTLTPEQIKAAHEALDQMAERAYSDRCAGVTGELSAAIRAALPPLPEPERPRITPARELAEKWDLAGSSKHTACFNAILAARAEIIAWWESEVIRCETCVRLMRAIRAADAP